MLDGVATSTAATGSASPARCMRTAQGRARRSGCASGGCSRSRCAPLPDKHRGLTDVDTRLRERYLDLIVNPESRRIFDIRSAVIASVRGTLLGARLHRGRDAGARRRARAARRRARSSPTTTRSTSTCTCGSRSSCRSSGSSSAASSASSRSGACSATRASTRATTPSSRCSRPTRRSRDYHDMMDLVEAICSEAARRRAGESATDLSPPWRRVTMADLIEEDERGADAPVDADRGGARDLRPASASRTSRAGAPAG